MRINSYSTTPYLHSLHIYGEFLSFINSDTINVNKPVREDLKEGYELFQKSLEASRMLSQFEAECLKEMKVKPGMLPEARNEIYSNGPSEHNVEAKKIKSTIIEKFPKLLDS